MPKWMTSLPRSGPLGRKRGILVVGEGITEADQAAYSDYVHESLMNDVFHCDCYYKDAQAFNVFRVNLIANEFGLGFASLADQNAPFPI